MSLDAVLNIVWAVIVLSAVGLLIRSELHHRHRAGRLRRFAAVLLFAVALFPCISASDDFFTLGFLERHGNHRGAGAPLPESSSDKAGLHLLWTLQSLEHFQVSRVYAPAVTLSFCALVAFSGVPVLTRDLVRRSGRAPPAL